ncbi:MAG: type II toxin-antitoxin system VapC family toxin [Blastocatellia bacterium]
MKHFVLDASVALAWFVDKTMPSLAVRARQLLLTGAVAVVPPLWHLEMANGLSVAERRRILSAQDAADSLTHLEQLLSRGIESNMDFVPARQAFATAQAYHLSAYDSVYLNLARQQKIPLATLDRQLSAAALQAHVELLR